MESKIQLAKKANLEKIKARKDILVNGSVKELKSIADNDNITLLEVKRIFYPILI
jgi:hypothetical protein